MRGVERKLRPEQLKRNKWQVRYPHLRIGGFSKGGKGLCSDADCASLPAALMEVRRMTWSKPAAIALAAVLVLAAAWPESLLAAAPQTPTDTLGCASPVGPRDTAAALRRRFGGNAKVESVPGAGVKTMPAL